MQQVTGQPLDIRGLGDYTVATPPADAFVNEPGVTNLFVQDKCPRDPVGHVGMDADQSVTTIISNALDASRPVVCGYGAPF